MLSTFSSEVSDEKREVCMHGPHLGCCLSRNVEILRGNSAIDLPQVLHQVSLKETEQIIDVIPWKKGVLISVSFITASRYIKYFVRNFFNFKAVHTGVSGGFSGRDNLVMECNLLL